MSVQKIYTYLTAVSVTVLCKNHRNGLRHARYTAVRTDDYAYYYYTRRAKIIPGDDIRARIVAARPRHVVVTFLVGGRGPKHTGRVGSSNK